MPASICDDLSIPVRLRREKRDVVPFSTDSKECLYRWFKPDTEYSDSGRLSSATIGEVFTPLYDVSCNRSSLCEKSTDVLYNTVKLPHRFNFGVIEASVESIHGHVFEYELNQKDGIERITIRFEVEHKPEECMYPHSQIVLYRNGVRVSDAIKPPTLKTATRSELALLFNVCHKPDPDYKLQDE